MKNFCFTEFTHSQLMSSSQVSLSYTDESIMVNYFADFALIFFFFFNFLISLEQDEIA